MKIYLIGSGNVATQLGTALRNCSHEILFVTSRNLAHAKKLAKKLGAKGGSAFDMPAYHAADVVIIAVKDDAIADVVKTMPPLKDTLVIHTSGATTISVLKKKFKNCGVIWQVQTIQLRSKIEFANVPMVIEGSNPSAEKKTERLIKDLTRRIYKFNSEQRKVLHLGAVWVNNFPNHFMYLGEQFLRQHRLPFELYNELILSTAKNAILNPGQAQTGPARRNDKKTMAAHLKLLPDKKYRALYKILSASITETYASGG